MQAVFWRQVYPYGYQGKQDSVEFKTGREELDLMYRRLRHPCLEGQQKDESTSLEISWTKSEYSVKTVQFQTVRAKLSLNEVRMGFKTHLGRRPVLVHKATK